MGLFDFDNENISDTEREIDEYQQRQQHGTYNNNYGYNNQQYVQNNYQQSYTQQNNHQHTHGCQQGYNQKYTHGEQQDYGKQYTNGNNQGYSRQYTRVYQQANPTGQPNYKRTYTNTYVNGVHTNRTVTTEYLGDSPNFTNNTAPYGSTSSVYGNSTTYQNGNAIYNDFSNAPEHEQTETPNAKMLKNIAMGWFIVSVIATLICAGITEDLIAVTIGQALVIIPAILFFCQKKIIGKILTIPFILVGIGLVVGGISNITGGDLLDKFLSQDAQGLSVIIFLCFTIGGIIGAIVFTKDLIKTIRECTVPVTATLVKYRKTTYRNKNGIRRRYYPVYSYEYNGRIYERKSKYQNFGMLRREGSVVEIKVNPYNPYEFRDKNTIPDIITTILGSIIFIVIGFTILTNHTFG